MPKKQEPIKVPMSNISGKTISSLTRNKIIKSKEFGKSEDLTEFMKNMPASAKVSSIITASNKKEHDLSYTDKKRLEKAIVEHFSQAYREERAEKIKERNVRRSIYEREDDAQGVGVAGGGGMMGSLQNTQSGFASQQKTSPLASIRASRLTGERVSRASIGGKTQLRPAGGPLGPSRPMKSPSLNKPSLKF